MATMFVATSGMDTSLREPSRIRLRTVSAARSAGASGLALSDAAGLTRILATWLGPSLTVVGSGVHFATQVLTYPFAHAHIGVLQLSARGGLAGGPSVALSSIAIVTAMGIRRTA